jgi:hypothetical protein
MRSSYLFTVAAILALTVAGLFAGRAGGRPPRVVYAPAYVYYYRPAYAAYPTPMPPPGVIVYPRAALYRPVYAVRYAPGYAVYYAPGAARVDYRPIPVRHYYPSVVYVP